jgi:hypothetical protein
MLGDSFIIITDEKIAEDLLVKRANIYSDRPQIRSLFDAKSTDGSIEYLTSFTLKSDTPGSRTSLRVDFALFVDFEAILFLFSLVYLPTLKKTLLLLLLPTIIVNIPRSESVLTYLIYRLLPSPTNSRLELLALNRTNYKRYS